jgi:hypothetical protein
MLSPGGQIPFRQSALLRNNLANKSVKMGKINLCPNFSQLSENTVADNTKNIDPENTLLEEKLTQANLKTVPRLIQLGLAAEQIAQGLDLELQLILQNFTKQ